MLQSADAFRRRPDSAIQVNGFREGTGRHRLHVRPGRRRGDQVGLRSVADRRVLWRARALVERLQRRVRVSLEVAVAPSRAVLER